MDSEKKVKIPKEFIDPISLEIMETPMIFPDGQTYEKTTIEKALKQNPCSPLTKIPMKFEEGKINYALKNLIENFLKENPNIKVSEEDKKPFIPKEKEKLTLNSISANYIKNPKESDSYVINIKAKLNPPEKKEPLLLISILDISGSMGSDACETVKGMEDLSFSRLQLVKHSMNTIISTLEDDDMLCLITFESKAKMLLEPIKMDKTGREMSLEQIKNIHPDGCTNLWDGLRVGINSTKKYLNSNYNIQLLLFTDGEPNINPPLGIIPSLKEILSDMDVNFIINTFAFGYDVDSVLMEDIAKIGNGIYGYCPDCTMVGTIFINFMSNILNLTTNNCFVHIQNKVLNESYPIGGFYQDSFRNFICKVDKNDINDTKIKLVLKSTNQEFNVDVGKETNDENEMKDILNQYYRFRLIDLINSNLEKQDKSNALKEIEALYKEIESLNIKTDFLNKILIDLINEHANHGQVQKAFENQYYNKWGKDYLRSFVRFHYLEQCGNFKDESLQLYGGDKFNEYRKKCNKIFLDLQPPEREDYGGGYHYSNNSFNRDDLDRFMDYYGGCFDGNGIVKLKNNKFKKVKHLIKGDVLFNGSIVNCVIIQKVKTMDFAVEINNVLFTPYHPIFYNGNWVFPINIKKPKEYYIDYWYNLILNNGISVNINDIDAITLGHNQNYGILKHPYFGTEKVINDLKLHQGFNQGIVFISEMRKCVRDQNGFVSSYY